MVVKNRNQEGKLNVKPSKSGVGGTRKATEKPKSMIVGIEDQIEYDEGIEIGAEVNVFPNASEHSFIVSSNELGVLGKTENKYYDRLIDLFRNGRYLDAFVYEVVKKNKGVVMSKIEIVYV